MNTETPSENPEPTNPTPSPAEPAPPLPPVSLLPATVPDGQQLGGAPVEPAPLATPGGSEPVGEPAETSVSALPAIVPGANLPDANPPEARSKPAPIQVSSVLGAVKVLSDAHQIEFYACEAVLETASSTFVQAGLAFARIRDLELYRMEYPNFDAYCRMKWQYGRRYVDFLIAAAQVFNHLRTISSQQPPQHETQVRPMVGLPPEQVQQAWQAAIAKAGNGKVTARHVQNAVKELRSEAPENTETPAAPKPRARMAAHRQMIDDAIGQLLLLLSQKASHDILTEKVEALHAQIHALFPKPSPKH
jgi:hypothetical protein